MGALALRSHATPQKDLGIQRSEEHPSHGSQAAGRAVICPWLPREGQVSTPEFWFLLSHLSTGASGQRLQGHSSLPTCCVSSDQ